MADITQQRIDTVIDQIANATAPESVTNEMVAIVLEFLNSEGKKVASCPDSLLSEAHTREAADSDLAKKLTNLQTVVNLVQIVAANAKSASDANKEAINAIVGTNASEAIDNFNEIISFLEGFRDSDTLAAALDLLRQAVADCVTSSYHDTSLEQCRSGIDAAVGISQFHGIFPERLLFILSEGQVGYVSDRGHFAYRNGYNAGDNYNVTDAVGTPLRARDDRLFRLGNSLYRYDGQSLVQFATIADAEAAATSAVSEMEARIIPQSIEVDAPEHLTFGNAAEIYVRASMLPEGVMHNVIYISDGKAVTVDHRGRLRIVGCGTSSIQVIPTCATALARTVLVEVSEPALRFTALHGPLRLSASGSLRLY